MSHVRDVTPFVINTELRQLIDKVLELRRYADVHRVQRNTALIDELSNAVTGLKYACVQERERSEPSPEG